MCPGCIGTALLMLSGASSAGGLAALKLRSLTRLRTAREQFEGGPPGGSGSSQPEPAYDRAGTQDGRAPHPLQAPHGARPGQTAGL